MGMIGLTLDFSGYSGDLIVVWRKASSPNTIAGQSDPLPFPVDTVYDINDIEPVVYIVQFWQSANGTSLDTLIRSWNIDASVGGGSPIVKHFDFIVGSGEDVGDGIHIAPYDQETEYLNDLLADPEIVRYDINKQGFGDLSFRTQIDKISTGGFRYKTGTPQEVFSQDEEYGITVYYKTSAVVAKASRYEGVHDAVSDFTLGSNEIRKLIKANWSTPVGTINLDPFSSYSPDDFVKIVSHTGAQNNVRLVCSGTEKLWFNGAQVPEIILGRDMLAIYFDGADCLVEDSSDSWNWIGTVRYGYDQRPNELPLDGTEFIVAEHPRTKAYMDSLPAGRVVSYAQWGQSQDVIADGITKTVYPYKGMFAISPDGTKFRTPDFRNISVRTLRFNDGQTDDQRVTQGIGGFQMEAARFRYTDTKGQFPTSTPRRPTNIGYKGENPNTTQFYEFDNISGSGTRPDNYGLPAFLKT